MKRFLKSKSFLITSILCSLLFIINIVATPDSTASDIALSLIKCLLAGVISGFVFGGMIFLLLNKKTT
ncbi:hypothetical protein [Paenibacillus sp. S150]|uniref:hypothetical protein n=1 Tax=Paenibacillus sp. S150 TaxID=2749826 RepID=UPI001C578602|nr:hypothetical protein [Paenibacillus sp. S150]MBW4084461.1 hypothetical protein [Paenibacillus sp. S150]